MKMMQAVSKETASLAKVTATSGKHAVELRDETRELGKATKVSTSATKDGTAEQKKAYPAAVENSASVTALRDQYKSENASLSELAKKIGALQVQGLPIPSELKKAWSEQSYRLDQLNQSMEVAKKVEAKKQGVKAVVAKDPATQTADPKQEITGVAAAKAEIQRVSLDVSKPVTEKTAKPAKKAHTIDDQLDKIGDLDWDKAFNPTQNLRDLAAEQQKHEEAKLVRMKETPFDAAAMDQKIEKQAKRTVGAKREMYTAEGRADNRKGSTSLADIAAMSRKYYDHERANLAKMISERDKLTKVEAKRVVDGVAAEKARLAGQAKLSAAEKSHADEQAKIIAERKKAEEEARGVSRERAGELGNALSAAADDFKSTTGMVAPYLEEAQAKLQTLGETGETGEMEKFASEFGKTLYEVTGKAKADVGGPVAGGAPTGVKDEAGGKLEDVILGVRRQELTQAKSGLAAAKAVVAKRKEVAKSSDSELSKQREAYGTAVKRAEQEQSNLDKYSMQSGEDLKAQQGAVDAQRARVKHMEHDSLASPKQKEAAKAELALQEKSLKEMKTTRSQQLAERKKSLSAAKDEAKEKRAGVQVWVKTNRMLDGKAQKQVKAAEQQVAAAELGVKEAESAVKQAAVVEEKKTATTALDVMAPKTPTVPPIKATDVSEEKKAVEPTKGVVPGGMRDMPKPPVAPQKPAPEAKRDMKHYVDTQEKATDATVAATKEARTEAAVPDTQQVGLDAGERARSIASNANVATTAPTEPAVARAGEKVVKVLIQFDNNMFKDTVVRIVQDRDDILSTWASRS